MADNTQLNAGVLGDILATDDIGSGVKVQRVKVGFGVDGSYADVTALNPVPVIATPNGVQSISLGREVSDAFGRLRVADPQTIFDSKQIYDKQPLFWDDQIVSGSGGASTFNANQASTTLSASASTAVVRRRQTFRRFNYQPGKSQLIFMTGIIGAPETGITRRIGQFDTNDGWFFESAPSGVRVVRRTSTSGSPATSAIAQASWNIDPMDGTGPSGITVDWSRVQIFGMNYEWLGVGSTWFFLVIDGAIYNVHRFDSANSGLLVYSSTPNLPLSYEITNDGTGGAANLLHICSAIMSEGGLSDDGFSFSLSRGATSLVTNNDANLYPLIAVRLKSTHLGHSVKLTDMSIVCTSTAAYEWQIIVNPTVTGTALSFSGVTNSAVEADVARTNATTVSGGTVIAGGVAQSTAEGGVRSSAPGDFLLGSGIAGNADIAVLAVRRLTGTTETFFANLAYLERG